MTSQVRGGNWATSVHSTQTIPHGVQRPCFPIGSHLGSGWSLRILPVSVECLWCAMRDGMSCTRSSLEPWGSRPLADFPSISSHPDGEITRLHFWSLQHFKEDAITLSFWWFLPFTKHILVLCIPSPLNSTLLLVFLLLTLLVPLLVIVLPMPFYFLPL